MTGPSSKLHIKEGNLPSITSKDFRMHRHCQTAKDECEIGRASCSLVLSHLLLAYQKYLNDLDLETIQMLERDKIARENIDNNLNRLSKIRTDRHNLGERKILGEREKFRLE